MLLSGGGSALLTLPAPGLTLADMREVNDQLLRSGAPIGEINCVRKHLSAITGGRLAAAAWPAQVVTFAISDVPGDDPAVIASGPTVGDPFDIRGGARDRGPVRPPATGSGPRAPRSWRETRRPNPAISGLARSRFILLATPSTALEAAASAARAAGLEPVVLGAEVQGEARLVAAEHAARSATPPRRKDGATGTLAAAYAVGR